MLMGCVTEVVAGAAASVLASDVIVFDASAEAVAVLRARS